MSIENAPTLDQKKKLLNDILDPNKVVVYCGTHAYFGPNKEDPTLHPHWGCSKCWFVYYLHDIATAPPDQRYERLQELDEVVHKVVEAVRSGNWTFQPYDRPHIEIEKSN